MAPATELPVVAEELEIGVVDVRDAGAVQDEPTPDTGFGPPPGRY
jgi:hypothetical protein